MRVVHLVHSLQASTGGTARAVEWLADACEARGWETVVAAAHADAASPRTRVFPLAGRAARSGSPELRAWFDAEAGRADLVVAHGLWQFPTNLLAASRTRASIVVPHGMLDPWFRRAYPLKHVLKQARWLLAESRAVNRATRVVFTADDEERASRGVFFPYGPRPAVCPLGIADPGRAGSDRAAAEAACPGLGDGRYLLFLARLHPKKGADLLLGAWARLGAATAGCSLVIAGPEEDASHAARLRELAAICAQAGAGPVLFPGMMRGEAKWSLLRHAEALVLASHQDNFGIAVAEALAVGTPVLVSTAVNIWREVVEDGAGRAAPPSHEGVLDMVRAQLDLAQVDANRMRAAARACFEKRFLDSLAARGWMDVFETAAREGAGKGGR